MIQALFLSVGQLFDRRVAMVFVKSLLVTLALISALAVGLWYGLRSGSIALGNWLETPAVSGDGTSFWGGMLRSTGSFLATASDDSTFTNVGTIVIMLVLLHLLLFRAIAVGVMDVFADDVVEAVEAKHYPQAHATARGVPFGQSVAMGLGSGVRAVLVNLLFSPLYLMLLITGIGTPIAFFIVNTWLLGRDLGDMVAARHMRGRDLPGWRSKTSFRRLRLGAVGTGLFLIPGVSLLAPVLGAAMATHMFHMGRRS
jgi:uncharacterized protein involved in cysteine biosynthesis